EAMKMEHVVEAPAGGIVNHIVASAGATVPAGAPLIYLIPGDVAAIVDEGAAAVDPDRIRPDLAELNARLTELTDPARPKAGDGRRKTGQRTTRENIADLCDAGSFIEYGGFALAAQRRRRSIEELRAISPADGLVAGIGAVNGDQFPDAKARCMVLSYDY